MYTGIAMLIHSLRGVQNPALPLQRKSRERTVFPRFLRPQATARIGFLPMRQSSITHYTYTIGGVPLQGACERCRTALFARFFRSRERRQRLNDRNRFPILPPSEGCNPYILMRLQPSFFRCSGMLSGRTRLMERMDWEDHTSIFTTSGPLMIRVNVISRASLVRWYAYSIPFSRRNT